jgi:hypothetical protein
VSYRQLSLYLSSAVLFASSIFVPAAKADEWNKKTVITLNSTVRIPGSVLVPGTYVFKLLDSPTDRNIVLVYNEAENDLIATVMAVPSHRTDVSGDTVLTFDSPESGGLPMLKKWFYPGDTTGREFLYPESSVRGE